MPFPSLLRRQEPGLKRSFSCRANSRHQYENNQILDFIENFLFSRMHEASKALLCAGHPPARVRHISGFAKISACAFYKGRLKNVFMCSDGLVGFWVWCKRHAYDYAALIVPTAVCICVGMHAVKRRSRTHEIHNLHKTHRPRSLQNQISVAPAQAGASAKQRFACFMHS